MEADETRMPFDAQEYAAAAYAQGKSLLDMQAELGEQLQSVRRSLYSLINKRYQDFLGLGTSLSGLDTSVASLREPLAEIKGKIQSAHLELHNELDHLDSRLAYRTQLREKKQMLRLFLDLGQLLERATMILQEAKGTTEQTDYVKCLERAAVDLSQIRYFAKKGEGLPFVVNAQPRIEQVEQLLLDALEQFLSSCAKRYVELATASKTEETDMYEVARSIAQSLRAYSAVEETDKAEHILRSSMVQPFAKRIFGSQPGRGMGLDPAKFSDMLQQILQFVKAVGVPLIRDIEVHLSAGSGSTGYHLATHVFWREIATSMMDSLPLVFVPGMPARFHKNYQTACGFVSAFGDVFSVADDASKDGVSEYEVLALDPTFIEFHRKWQLPAYFSIQKKLIVGTLEGGNFKDTHEALSDLETGQNDASRPQTTSMPSKQTKPDQPELETTKRENGLLTEQAAQALWAVSQCWSRDVYLVPLAASFWQLTVQILLWYQHSVEEYVQQLMQPQLADTGADQLLRHIHDTYAVNAAVTKQIHTICQLIPIASDHGSEEEKSMISSLRTAATRALAPLDELVRKARDTVASTVVSQCTANLASNLRRTTSQYRHTNRPPPTAASVFVSKLFTHMTDMETKIDSMEPSNKSVGLGPTIKQILRNQIAKDVSKEFAQVCLETLITLSKTEASLQRLRNKSRGAGARVDTGYAGDLPVPPGIDLRGKAPDTDNDKIRRQIWLDVAQLSQIISEYGVEPSDELSSFAQLIRPFGK
ncbi:hypothetical protein EV183_003060 [Coemansia sp. RSA 2336]|nr:hypothetical protein EV183_003060 [Coemansia sp. RSA 2336]